MSTDSQTASTLNACSNPDPANQTDAREATDWSHQPRAIQQLRESIARGNRRVILRAPTASGKTRIAIEMIKSATAKGMRSAFICDQTNLHSATLAEFDNAGLPVGVIKADHPRTDPMRQVQLISVQTLPRRWDWIEQHGVEFDMILIDEVHLIYQGWIELMARNPKAVIVGLSASPFTKGLGLHFDDVVVAADYVELMQKGVLVDIDVWEPAVELDMSELRVNKDKDGDEKDFTDKSSSKLFQNLVAREVIPFWKERGCDQMTTLVFTPLVSDADNMAQMFMDAGYDAYSYHSYNSTDPEKRRMDDEALECFKSGSLQIMTSVSKIIKGVDIRRLECVIDCAPTKSMSRHIQKIGRLLRACPETGKKKGVVLDMVSNMSRNLWPQDVDDIGPELDMGEKGSSADHVQQEREARKCPECHALVAPRMKICGHCGFILSHQSQLGALGIEMVKAERDSKPPKSAKKEKAYTIADKQLWYSSFLGYAKKQGKSQSWVLAKYKSKFGVWPRKMKDIETEPPPEVLGYIKHSNIAYAKRMQNEKQQAQPELRP